MAIILVLASGMAGLGAALFAWLVLHTGLLGTLAVWSVTGTVVFAFGLCLAMLPGQGPPPVTRPQPV